MKADLHRDVKRTLAKKHACYILITCNQPSGGGEMAVEMSYEGDALLASYLLQGAQSIVDNDLELQSIEDAPELRVVEKRPKRQAS